MKKLSSTIVGDLYEVESLQELLEIKDLIGGDTYLLKNGSDYRFCANVAGKNGAELDWSFSPLIESIQA